ncbi:GNAT family N-acetyltransferase [Bacillus sp. B-jedd]|uniref:GNAT family N-acetyltransferase n=1 Tax=Bacillus sp. B-jedd TaxID=1476857 RepID=UPI00051555F3|nr:GNAT family N-acetyltransferase [Bacillus sp. B-jedd]CEG26137.1 N-acetyltransferase GCN5 [Bacillus sp. B-jedd]
MKVDIRRPLVKDVEELNRFFRTVITDTFEKEGIGDKVDDLEEEIGMKMSYLQSDLENGGLNRYFLVAIAGGKIIGSIEFGPASALIAECTKGALSGLMEVGTVFVHPAWQRQGVGSLLLQKIGDVLVRNGLEDICLDSGYIRAQAIWKKKFGPPEYVLKDYWGEGFDHFIWKIKVKDLMA